RQRIEVVVARAALLPPILRQAPLAPHAEPLERAERALVLHRAERLDADEPEMLEAEAEEETRRLGRVALPPVGTCEPVAELGAAVARGDDAQVDAADHQIGRPQHDGTRD